jgi:hypothetical protein
MKYKHWAAAAAGAIALGFAAATSAGAAPAGALTGLQTAAGGTSAVEEARYGRRCWRHRGRLHCRRVHHRRHYYGYAPYYYGGAPLFSFRFGGHRHHRHFGHHRRWR